MPPEAPLLSPATLAAVCKMVMGCPPRVGDPPFGIDMRTHYALEEFFSRADVELPSEAIGGMRKRAKAALEGLNKTPGSHSALVRLIEELADTRNYFKEDERHQRTIEYLNEYLKRDGLQLISRDGASRLQSVGVNKPLTHGLSRVIDGLGFAGVSADFERALQAAEHDPEDAITAACSTVESVCKCILDEMERPYPPKQDIKGLVSEVGKHLRLSPARDDLPAELIADIKQVLSGLLSVTSGIGALRTHGGDAHGRGRKKAPVDARIARLAVHAASTVSLFYIETWNRMKAGSASGSAE